MCDKKEKENAYYNFIEMIEKSWTFEKLTKEEKNYYFSTGSDAVSLKCC